VADSVADLADSIADLKLIIFIINLLEYLIIKKINAYYYVQTWVHKPFKNVQSNAKIFIQPIGSPHLFWIRVLGNERRTFSSAATEQWFEFEDRSLTFGAYSAQASQVPVCLLYCFLNWFCLWYLEKSKMCIFMPLICSFGEWKCFCTFVKIYRIAQNWMIFKLWNCHNTNLT